MRRIWCVYPSGDACRPPEGHVVVATFGPEGPTKCSGLEVVRYDLDGLHDQFGRNFRLLRHLTEIHRTPAGAAQQFAYCYCKTSEAPETAGTPEHKV